MTHQTSVSGTNNLKLIDLLGVKYIEKCRGKKKINKKHPKGKVGFAAGKQEMGLGEEGGSGGGDS